MWSIGAGYHQNAWSVDFSYTFMQIINRSINGNGSVSAPVYQGQLKDGTAHLIGLTFGYKF